PYDFLVALDMETTCDESYANRSDVKVPRDHAEVIELSFAVVSVQQHQAVHQQQFYVKPEKSVLTPFATAFTGITQAQLDTAELLKVALANLDSFIQTHFISQEKRFCFVVLGESDLRYQLTREAREKGITLPSYFNTFYDIVQEVASWTRLFDGGARRPPLQKSALLSLCNTLGVSHEGRLNSALDDAASISRVTVALLDNVEQWLATLTDPLPETTKVPLTSAIDLAKQLNDFHSTQSKIVHLGGLPHKSIYSDVETWVGLAGVQPASLWMNRNMEGRADGTGYAVFRSHEDAKACLALNHRILGDRTIQISPATEATFEASADDRIPYPVRFISADMKPGDWMCPGCSYHNFASRRSCFKCHTNNPSPSAAFPVNATMMSQTLKPGDWICPNPQCKFQNFAARLECMRCRGRKPAMGMGMNMGMNMGGYGGYGAPPRAQGISAKPGGRGGRGGGDRPGDWSCPNDACRYHNYASRTECYRCGT
ncbi:ribonuclease H-like domain-containing protein, partial [Blyttiomyces helicus]